MKKYISALLAFVFLATAVLVLTSCSNQSVNPDLVGMWVRENNPGLTMSLNDTGGGRRGGTPGEAFDWTASSSELRINRRNAPSREIANERWNFTLENDVLRIASRQQSGLVRYYLRDGAVGEVDQALVGTWAWEGDLFWEYVLNPDGTGERGTPGDMAAFTWGVVDGVMRLRLNSVPVGHVRNQHWDFTITGDNLHLSNRHNNDAFNYIRDGGMGTPDLDLVGRWNWDEYPNWRYHFNEDGTGNRGVPVTAQTPNTMARIYWGVTANGELRILPQVPVALGQVYRADRTINNLERWGFTIDGDALHLQNLDNPSEAYYYTRD